MDAEGELVIKAHAFIGKKELKLVQEKGKLYYALSECYQRHDQGRDHAPLSNHLRESAICLAWFGMDRSIKFFQLRIGYFKDGMRTWLSNRDYLVLKEELGE